MKQSLPIGYRYIDGQLIRIYPNDKIAKQIKSELQEDWKVSCNKCGDDRPFDIRK